MKRKRSGIITKIVILAMAIYAGVNLMSLKSEIAEAKKIKAGLETELSGLVQKNAELQYEIEHASELQTIEDIARNKLGLVKPGEIIFFDISN